MTTPNSSILEAILEWSQDRPAWQRDALRRLVQQPDVTEADVDQLLLMCKAAHGIDVQNQHVSTAIPLTKEHIPTGGAAIAKVSLLSISEVQNVNALAPSQKLKFASFGLTVIYGDNASGKSGYARILRSVCRARARDCTIKPNVYEASSSAPASAVISYHDGTADQHIQWIDGHAAPPELSVVSFFDSDCALVHVGQANELAYTPYGLDVLEKLANVCRNIQHKLAEEIEDNDTDFPATLRAHPSQKTTGVSKLLESLSPDTNLQDVRELATLTEEETKRIEQLASSLAQDPKTIATQLRAQARRLATLIKPLNTAFEVLAPENVAALRAAAEDCAAKEKAAQVAATTLFRDEPLKNVGGPAWRALWDAARRYSQTDVYPNLAFPVTDQDSRCVLCQQPLHEDAKGRFARFEQFVRNDTQEAAEDAKRRLDQLAAPIKALDLRTSPLRETINELRSVDEAAATATRKAIVLSRLTARSVLRSLCLQDWSTLRPLPDPATPSVQAVIDAVNARADELDASANPQQRAELEDEYAQLQDRRWLSTVIESVWAEIERLSLLRKLDRAKRDTATNSITAKSKALADEHVTSALRDRFADELERLDLRRVRVEIAKAPGQYGASNYQIRFIAAPNEPLQAVLSEGEHRCIALAGFLADLSTASNASGLVFDDPVSSLDHRWRLQVARRLVEQAKTRQVIVFTHDIVFLHELLDSAQRSGISSHIQRLYVDNGSPGTVSDELPWNMRTVKGKINHLQQRARAARGLDEAGDEDGYENAVRSIYGELRATVEEVIEKIVFNDVILRYREHVKIGYLKKVSAVEVADCDFLMNLHNKCSGIITAHSRFTGRHTPPPNPTAVLQDVNDLAGKVQTLRDKQKIIK